MHSTRGVVKLTHITMILFTVVTGFRMYAINLKLCLLSTSIEQATAKYLTVLTQVFTFLRAKSYSVTFVFTTVASTSSRPPPRTSLAPLRQVLDLRLQTFNVMQTKYCVAMCVYFSDGYAPSL